MADTTLPFLTRVVGVIDDQTGEHRGTGFFCMLGGRQAVVTAAHVLRDAAKTGRFQSLAFTRGPGEPPGIVAGTITYADQFDLAIYLPSRSFPIGEQKSFWPEERIERNPDLLLKDYLFVQGFPRRFSRFTTLGGNALVSETLAYGAMMRYRSCDVPSDEKRQFDRDLPDYPYLPDEFLQPHQFALNFSVEPASFIAPGGRGLEQRQSIISDWSEVFQANPETTFGDTFPEQKSRGAHGMSGSPVWRIGAASRPVKDWSPSWSQLIGIVTGWNEARQVLVATSASKLDEVLKTP
ncbi:MAG: hypothetical protein ABI453_16590 [Isosphaeraceae bacterium]